MKHTRPLVVLFALCPLATGAIAATEFDGDVPAEVVQQVVGPMLGGQLRLYSDLPDGFPPFEVPRDMTLLASVDQGYSQRVILKSQFDQQAATALAYGALLDSGWELVSVPGMQPPQTGFINPSQPVPPTQLCHDAHGMVQVTAQVGSGTTYVTLTRIITPPGMQAQSPDCNPQPVAVDPSMPEPYRFLQAQMPRLELPTGGGMSSSGGYGDSGGPNDWEARAQVNGPWDIARAFTYFTGQIEAQGWDEDASVVGANMATGSWTKTVEDAELVGTLVVLMTDANAYDLRFRLVRKGPPNFGMFGGDRGIRRTMVMPANAAALGPPLNAPALGIRGAPTGTAIPNVQPGASIVPRSGNIRPIGTTEIMRD
ncbi:MAG TPA: hypothetical protein VGE69_11730 [Pseudomonadales bacterium]